MKKYPALITIGLLLLNALLVWIGRIYFPANFHPETVSFFENYWVITIGEITFLLIGVSVVSLFIFLWNKIKDEIRNLLK